tara:strand:+ start:1192 stop:2007 length:816 start_codon:yes stop_codon:yes gene_type:complete
MFDSYRAEISFKSIEQLSEKIEFFMKNNILKINIPCKGNIKKDFLIEIVKYLGKNYPNLDIVYHYSFYHQYIRNKNESYEYFLEFIDKCCSFNNKEILLVSGSNKRKGFDSISVLNELKYYFSSNIKFGVAFNPYFSLTNEIKEERDRLLEKLSSGLINSIWLQLGSDINLLDNGILFLKKNIKNNSFNKEQDIKLYGSLFVPTKQSLARFKFRPWKGVFFSDQYLNSIEKAEYLTRNILKIYLKNKIDLLIESECSSIKQLKNAKSILAF